MHSRQQALLCYCYSYYASGNENVLNGGSVGNVMMMMKSLALERFLWGVRVIRKGRVIVGLLNRTWRVCFFVRVVLVVGVGDVWVGFLGMVWGDGWVTLGCGGHRCG